MAGQGSAGRAYIDVEHCHGHAFPVGRELEFFQDDVPLGASVYFQQDVLAFARAQYNTYDIKVASLQ